MIKGNDVIRSHRVPRDRQLKNKRNSGRGDNKLATQRRGCYYL
jgi:hypothetical protein